MIRGRAIKLSVEEGLPTEFRLFVPGWNDTENGRFLFDDKAAKAVMSAYAAWGVDLAIDLEHQMLEVEPGKTPDPEARDARGWCKLELRNGELWACEVTWTPDGASRLTNKTQRYVSPAFEADPKTKRVLKMINVAITAMPATHKTPALVAASARGNMDPSLVKQALEAIEKGDAKAALDILKGLVASAAGADPDADGDEDGSEGDGAEGVAPEAEAEAVEDPKVVDASADEPPPSSKGGDGDGDGDDDDDDDGKPAKKAAKKAALAFLRRLTGKSSLLEAVAEVETFRASHVTLETERKQLSLERATLESAERRKLCAELVKLGAEFPSTVWADDKAQTPKARWAKMPIAELRSHVVEQRAARGGKQPTGGLRPPPGNAGEEGGEAIKLDDGRVVQLSAREMQICKSQDCDPKNFASLKSFRDGASDFITSQRKREAEINARMSGKGN